MKKIQFIVFMLAIGLFSACDKHDMLDDNLIIGEMAPQVYWELRSTTVDAGSDVPFAAQYYTIGEAALHHLEAWYNVMETIDKAVSCPWLTPNFSKTSSVSESKRIDEKAAEFPHQESYWDATLRSYTFTAAFPTSVTLSRVEWIKPETFDAEDMDRIIALFGESFPQEFRDEVYSRMKEADFQKMLQGLGLIDNFRNGYLEEVYNENTGQTEYLFPKDDQGNRSVPAEVKAMYDGISFPDLILNTTTSTYEVEYIRSYTANAYLKAIDAKGNTGMTSPKVEITLN